MIENIEKTVIATLIDNYDLFEDCSLKSEYFYNLKYGKIFEVLKKLHKKELPFDENLILKELDSSYESVILQLLATTSISNVKTYEKMITENFEKREFQKFLKLKLNDLEDDDTSYLNVLNQVNSYKSNSTNYDNSLFEILDSDEVEAELPEILIPNICPIQKKEINFFTSKGGMGKSFTLLYLLLELQNLGFNCFGFFTEDSDGATKNRINLLKTVHKHLKNVKIKFGSKKKRLQSIVKQNKDGTFEASDYFYAFKKAMKPYDIIVIDPLISLILKDENSNVEARFIMNLLNEWIEEEDKTLLIIHHEGKGENAGSRGASAFIDAVRIHYSISKIENSIEKRKLKLEKCNHYSGESEFEVKLFPKNIPVVIEFKDENKKKSIANDNDFDEEKIANFDLGGIEILYDESPKEEALKLKKDMANKGVLFDD